MIEITQEQIMQNWNSEIPLVSISCITYNHEPYIAQALNGFLMQKTSFPFEVLIHDDASTDRTADILREYEKKFPNLIKPIYQKENQYSKGFTSVSATWNFPRAQGKYIALCEGDDYWIDENKLQMQVDFLEKNPEYGLTYTLARIFLQEKKRFSNQKAGRRFISYEDYFVNGTGKIDLCKIAEGCGYKKILKASNYEELDKALNEAKTANILTFVEAKSAIGARDDLGRPTTTAQENKINFMQELKTN